MSENIPGPNRALEIQIPCIVFMITTPLFVGMRLWARIRSKAGFGWDDWTSLASATFAMIVMAFMLASCSHGFGQHIANLSPSNKIMTLKMFFVSQVFYKLTINTTKMSILLLYLRIFVQRWFRIACYILLAIVFSYMVAAFFASVFQCTPVPRAWNKTIAGTCINITTNWYANAGFSIATDLTILALPMQPIYTSNLRMRQKAAVMVLFALGAFVAVTSILRMQTLDFSSSSTDTTYDLDSSIWTMIEENIAIICSCLPMMRGPLSICFPSIFTPRTKTSNYESGDISNGNSTTGSGGLRSPRNQWTQLHGYPDHRAGINLNEISASQKRVSGDSTGQILPPADSGPNHQRRSRSDASGIRKVLQYQVSYAQREASHSDDEEKT
ncbi:integral membrane protein [Pestalotiopsis sp. NC0098]|nr:integral membrane protein [Pestalotiopsis sp. NC0098]